MEAGNPYPCSLKCYNPLYHLVLLHVLTSPPLHSRIWRTPTKSVVVVMVVNLQCDCKHAHKLETSRTVSNCLAKRAEDGLKPEAELHSNNCLPPLPFPAKPQEKAQAWPSRLSFITLRSAGPTHQSRKHKRP